MKLTLCLAVLGVTAAVGGGLAHRQGEPTIEPLSRPVPAGTPARPGGDASPGRLYTPNQCGPNALFAVFKLYRIDVSLPETSLLCDCTPQGTTIAGLIRAAEAKGLAAAAYTADLDYLKGLARPAIIDLPTGHYCVFAGWQGDRAVILDPPHPAILWPVQDLDRHWGRHVIVFGPGADE